MSESKVGQGGIGHRPVDMQHFTVNVYGKHVRMLAPLSSVPHRDVYLAYRQGWNRWGLYCRLVVASSSVTSGIQRLSSKSEE